MISGNGVPAASDRDEGVRDSQQLRDIQDLIAKLEVVNRQLSLPLREMPTPRAVRPGFPADPSAPSAPSAPGSGSAEIQEI